MQEYIHIVDLEQANIAEMEKINILESNAIIKLFSIAELSVLQMVNEFEKQSDKTVRYQRSQHRSGDALAVKVEANNACDKLKLRQQVDQPHLTGRI